MALLVAAAVVAIFVTMAPGQRMVTRLGLRRLQKGAAPEADRVYLLQACEGDPAAVAARLDAVRSRYPDWDEAQVYRRAIRAVMNERGTTVGGTSEANETNAGEAAGMPHARGRERER